LKSYFRPSRINAPTTASGSAFWVRNVLQVQHQNARHGKIGHTTDGEYSAFSRYSTSSVSSGSSTTGQPSTEGWSGGWGNPCMSRKKDECSARTLQWTRNYVFPG
jgi:hypothetical protein